MSPGGARRSFHGDAARSGGIARFRRRPRRSGSGPECQNSDKFGRRISSGVGGRRSPLKPERSADAHAVRHRTSAPPNRVRRRARPRHGVAGAADPRGGRRQRARPCPPIPARSCSSNRSDWQRGEEYTHFWFDRMAHDSPRPIQEKMAFFWHGHFCSDLSKVERRELMQQQIDLFRTDGLGNLRTLAKTMSTQVAMIRYLDNNHNRQDVAQPELRPRADGAVPARRRQLHRGRTSRRRPRRGPATPTTGRPTPTCGAPTGTTTPPSRSSAARSTSTSRRRPRSARLRDDRHHARHRRGAGTATNVANRGRDDPRGRSRVHLPQVVDGSSPARRLRRR